MNLLKQLQNFINSHKNPIIVILGPTASGKTALSLKIAEKFNGEIISTDSRQIYRYMEIGTDAITKEQQKNIPHHLLGITTPDKPITLAQYKKLAISTIKDVYKRKNIPILVGGTGLYISSIIENYDIPKAPPDKKLRIQLEKLAKEKGKEHVHKELQKLNPKIAAEIHPNNLRYVIRAIELATLKKTPSKTDSEFSTFIIGIDHPREELYQRVNQRVDRQIERGLVDEVKKLLKKLYSEDLPAMSSLGVKEIIPFIKKESTLQQCVEILKRHTRRYAKRQMTWFRRYANVRWIGPDELNKLLENG